jgi:hypothetical protein
MHRRIAREVVVRGSVSAMTVAALVAVVGAGSKWW